RDPTLQVRLDLVKTLQSATIPAVERCAATESQQDPVVQVFPDWERTKNHDLWHIDAGIHVDPRCTQPDWHRFRFRRVVWNVHRQEVRPLDCSLPYYHGPNQPDRARVSVSRAAPRA